MNDKNLKDIQQPELPQQDLSELNKLVPDKINNEDIKIGG